MKRFLWFALLLAAALPAWAADWEVDHSQSLLGFSGTQQDGRFEGRFHQWSARIHFDPLRPKEGLFDVRVQIASVDTGSGERDRYLPDKTWFAAGKFPEARFLSTGFNALGGDRYLARGELTLRGITQEIELPFSWESRGEQATLRVETRLDRTDFGIGQGEFSGSDVIGHSVQVLGVLSLHKLPAAAPSRN